MSKDVAIVPLYTFTELDEKTQQCIVDNARSNFAENIDFDFDISCFLVKAEKNGLHVKQEDIRYSLGGVQGDGASFVTNDIDFRKVIENSGIQDSFPVLRDEQSLGEILEGLEGEIYRVEKVYTHKDTVTASVTYDGKWGDTGDRIAAALEGILSDIKDDLCESLYENLQATQDNECSDETIRDYFQYGKEKFFVDGTKANPEWFAYSNEAKQAKAFLNLPLEQRTALGDMIDHEAARLALGLERN